jgi:hypothetical protein
VYGDGQGKLHLLARRLRLLSVDATAPVPGHMREALRACGAKEEVLF